MAGIDRSQAPRAPQTVVRGIGWQDLADLRHQGHGGPPGRTHATLGALVKLTGDTCPGDTPGRRPPPGEALLRAEVVAHPAGKPAQPAERRRDVPAPVVALFFR